MRPLLDDAEKDDLAAREAFLGRGETQGDRVRGEDDGARLPIVELDDEVLVTPHRNKEACRVGDAFEDPAGVAAAQTGAFEPGMGVEIGRSHSGETGISTAVAATGDRKGMTGYSPRGSPAADRPLANSVRSGRKQP